MIYRHKGTGIRVRLEKVGRNRWEGRMRSADVEDVFTEAGCFIKNRMEWKYNTYCSIVLDLERGETPARYRLERAHGRRSW